MVLRVLSPFILSLSLSLFSLSLHTPHAFLALGWFTVISRTVHRFYLSVTSQQQQPKKAKEIRPLPIPYSFCLIPEHKKQTNPPPPSPQKGRVPLATPTHMNRNPPTGQCESARLGSTVAASRTHLMMRIHTHTHTHTHTHIHPPPPSDAAPPSPPRPPFSPYHET